MVNVLGNLIVQSDDVDIHERGIDLAFRRTFNSQSQHDYGNDDGSVVGQYGQDWTNNFDAHLIANSTNTLVTIYDIDGARYDYTCASDGSCTPPPGMQGTTLHSTASCTWSWTKRNGTVYQFYGTQADVNCGYAQLVDGRLREIMAANWNNNIKFTYWHAGGSDYTQLTSITAVHSDGQQLTLTFDLFNNRRLLASVTRPDQQQITYQYDSAGRLLEVDLPTNGTGNPPPTRAITYSYNGNQIAQAMGPRFSYQVNHNPGNIQDGGAVYFDYDSTWRVTTVEDHGVMNFAPNSDDSGANSSLQTGITGGNIEWCHSDFTYGSGQTTLTDCDNHETVWLYDSLGRVTQTNEYSTKGGSYLKSIATWDSANDLTSTTDPRGGITDYAYDQYGDTIAEALPAISTPQGLIRPTNLYSYDVFTSAGVTYTHVSRYCDPVAVGSAGYDWVNRPESDTLCSGGTRLTWDHSDPMELYGRLTETKSACYPTGCSNPGKHEVYAYDTTQGGGGDFGLPTSVTEDSFQQNDGQTYTPEQQFAYDGYGNLVCYSKQHESGTTHWWRLAYDQENRQTAVADPDDASLTASQCANTAGLTGSHIQTTTTYFPDDQVASTQNPSEYATGVSTTFSYDRDGNEITEQHHYGCTTSGCTPEPTRKWYDGADRLVQTQLPLDANDYNTTFHWQTRYLYDLSNGQQVSFGGSLGFYAHGNLYETEVYLPISPYSGWAPLKGTAYDGLDREKAQYYWEPAASGNTLQETALTYDENGFSGLLTTKKDAVGATTTYAYDADAHLQSTTYTDGTPNETLAYDADGRVVTNTSSTLGSQQDTFDADGRLIKSVEPGQLPSHATLTYNYYPSGWKSAVSVSSSAFSQTNALQYDYRNDGTEKMGVVTSGSNSAQLTRTFTPAGRLLTQAYSGGKQTRTLTYGPHGRLASDSGGPGAPYGSFAYDDEGEPTSYTAFGQTVTQRYTARGELQQQVFPQFAGTCGTQQGGLEWAGVRQKIIDGYPVPITWGPDDSKSTSCSWNNHGNSFDPLTGVALGTSDNDASNVTTNGYDADGRQTGTAQTLSGIHCVADTCDPWSESGRYDKYYDAENHLTKQVYTTWAGGFACPPEWAGGSAPPRQQSLTLTYVWGPNGHVAQATNSTGTETLHWDGDEVLFTTNGSGVDDVKLGADADIWLNSGTWTVQFNERDFSGALGAPPNPNRQLCGSSIQPPIWQPGRDGITDGYNVFQGVRNYDPVLGTWSTPDAYAGSVRDPMSQRAYMWNRNNSFIYADPTGYLTFGDVYNFLVGDDINTLSSSSASNLAKVAAGADLVLSLVPDLKGGEALMKLGVKVLTNHAILRMTERKITTEMIGNTLKNGTKLIQKSDGAVVRVLEGAGPGGRTVITITSADGKAVETVIDTSSNRTLQTKVDKGLWLPVHGPIHP